MYCLFKKVANSGELVNRVIDVCRRRFGERQWANVPEECWDEALEQMGIGKS